MRHEWEYRNILHALPFRRTRGTRVKLIAEVALQQKGNSSNANTTSKQRFSGGEQNRSSSQLKVGG